MSSRSILPHRSDVSIPPSEPGPGKMMRWKSFSSAISNVSKGLVRMRRAKSAPEPTDADILSDSTHSCRTESEYSSAESDAVASSVGTPDRCPQIIETTPLRRGVSIGMAGYQVKFVMQKNKKQPKTRRQQIISPMQLPEVASDTSSSIGTRERATPPNTPSLFDFDGTYDEDTDANSDPAQLTGLTLPCMLLAVGAVWLLSYGFVFSRGTVDYVAVSSDIEQFLEFICCFGIWFACLCAVNSLLMLTYLAKEAVIQQDSLVVNRALYLASQCTLLYLAYQSIRLAVHIMNMNNGNVADWVSVVLWLCCGRQTISFVMKQHSFYVEHKHQPHPEATEILEPAPSTDLFSIRFWGCYSFNVSPALVFNISEYRQTTHLADAFAKVWTMCIVAFTAVCVTIVMGRVLLWPRVQSLLSSMGDEVGLQPVWEFALSNM
jgi:hypothetical protein